MDETIASEIAAVFSDFLTKGVKQRGVSRKKLVQEIYRYCVAIGRRDQAAFWEHADSDGRLKQWLLKEAQFTKDELSEFLKEKERVPGTIRKALMETAKVLTPLSGGKPPALDLAEKIEARRRVKELHDKGMSFRKAWKKVARDMDKKEITIRRACDPTAAKRGGNRTSAGEAIILFNPDPKN